MNVVPLPDLVDVGFKAGIIHSLLREREDEKRRLGAVKSAKW